MSRYKPRVVSDFWGEGCEVHGPDDCWPAQGRLESTGYGQFYCEGRRRQSHIIAWELTRGPVPPGKVLDHLCRNRSCCNPAHLEPVTSRENIMRGFGACAIHARKTECPQGHPYDKTNTLVYRGYRYCRACRRDRATA